MEVAVPGVGEGVLGGTEWWCCQSVIYEHIEMTLRTNTRRWISFERFRKRSTLDSRFVYYSSVWLTSLSGPLAVKHHRPCLSAQVRCRVRHYAEHLPAMPTHACMHTRPRYACSPAKVSQSIRDAHNTLVLISLIEPMVICPCHARGIDTGLPTMRWCAMTQARSLFAAVPRSRPIILPQSCPQQTSTRCLSLPTRPANPTPSSKTASYSPSLSSSPPSTGAQAYAREWRDDRVASPNYENKKTCQRSPFSLKMSLIHLPALDEILEVVRPLDPLLWLIFQLGYVLPNDIRE